MLLACVLDGRGKALKESAWSPVSAAASTHRRPTTAASSLTQDDAWKPGSSINRPFATPPNLPEGMPRPPLCRWRRQQQQQQRPQLSLRRRFPLTADPSVDGDDVHLPQSLAMSLTFPEKVTEQNKDWLQALVRNGPKAYPGASFICHRTTGHRTDLLCATGRRRVGAKSSCLLITGDTVHRHVIDHDIVFMHRQARVDRVDKGSRAHYVRVKARGSIAFSPDVAQQYSIHGQQKPDVTATVRHAAASPVVSATPVGSLGHPTNFNIPRPPTTTRQNISVAEEGGLTARRGGGRAVRVANPGSQTARDNGVDGPPLSSDKQAKGVDWLRLIVAGQRCPYGAGSDANPLARRNDSLVGHGYTLIFATDEGGHDHRTEKQLRLQYPACNGHTCLTSAVRAGDAKAARSLICKFGDDLQVTTTGAIQSTCVGLAVMYGHMDCLRMVAAAGGNIHKATKCGVTPVYIACQKGHVEMLRFLIQAGASIHQERENGATPCLVACDGGHADCLALLLATGAVDVDAKTDEGVTPAHLAALKGHLNILHILKTAGANLFSLDARGLAPLQAAKAGKHRLCVRFLQVAERNP